MNKTMLIDAGHAEETRVAVVDDKRLVEFDYESVYRKQLKGSVFLAKVTRVEPSLQAAFVNFGGNRHGFLPFSEIHPDYYRIPIADREALIAEQQEALEAQAAAEEAEDMEGADEHEEEPHDDEDTDTVDEVGGEEPASENSDQEETAEAEADSEQAEGDSEDEEGASKARRGRNRYPRTRGRGGRGRGRAQPHRSRRTDTVGGDEAEYESLGRFNLTRRYKIQEVIKRGQIMLIQVSKEERGNKGAAITTYLSLPGRYCVLMPNSPRGGGVSRKISSFQDRRKMRDLLKELEVPQGMSVILRTAGLSRTKTEVKRDLDYLSRLWDNIRENTLQSSAPALIYEEGNLIKRAIRDLYTREVEEVLVTGAKGYAAARDHMKMLVPSHVRRVKEYKDERIPLFQRYGIESQINDIGRMTVQLRSGGSLVINPTEALVSIDVNSGRATKERHIEETALKTNLEAAREVARQLRLRDLGGLVVIDFIDMEDRRNNGKVERALKDALASDRARIQIGRISSFGLLELSRQRLNPSLTEAQFEKCPHCRGTGTIRSVDSLVIMALRALEEEGVKGRAGEVGLTISSEAALYILNYKRTLLADIEQRYGFKVTIITDKEPDETGFSIDVLKGISADDDGDEEEALDASQDSDDKSSAPHAENREDTSQGERRGNRRRGRRGGRNRNRNRRDYEEGNQDAPEPKTDAAESSAAENSETDSERPAGDKPKRRRSSAASKSGKDESVKEEVPVEEAKPKAEDKPKPKTTRKSSSAKPNKTDEAVKEEKTAARKPATRKKAPAKATPAAKEVKSEAAVKEDKPAPAQASEPTAVKSEKPAVPPAHKQYETVNPDTGEKRKGWWNKLVS